MVLGTVFSGEMEKILQLKDTVAYQAGVIRLANGGNTDTIYGDSKHGELSGGELLIVSQFIEPIAQAPTLLDAK